VPAAECEELLTTGDVLHIVLAGMARLEFKLGRVRGRDHELRIDRHSVLDECGLFHDGALL
jgi:hypothetical protein